MYSYIPPAESRHPGYLSLLTSPSAQLVSEAQSSTFLGFGALRPQGVLLHSLYSCGVYAVIVDILRSVTQVM